MRLQNDMIQKQLSHRTIREFKNERIPQDKFNLLMEVARHTASSTGMQACSIIRVTNAKIRKDIADVCRQEYVARAPELLIFVLDHFRNRSIANEKKNSQEKLVGMYHFFQGFLDASLTAQNVVNAAESMNMGTVFLGSILNDSEKICELLSLPQMTFPVIGLGIGYPNQEPQLKPRMPMDLRLFENKYTCFDSYLKNIKEYDEEMQTYYDLRDANRRVDSFSNQVVSRFYNLTSKQQEILNTVRNQGFDLKVK
ncbi:NADPH-dependent oxidoreductase [Tissierella sp. Yu-01]|uniref:NADPH-dependent oxidoreductase n=1 Tax=Tissierella sp. Yu-01 TaxID=3035694 RepID=UPI00240E3703|nr:NADPH-dependent oxidoreductase [Tissierella sp. Yu-01]WFA08658.1 NADPH-dependent oxidoreductase [Tissierella sp. Yu-01]